MTMTESLVELLQEDLKNERMHLAFYAHAAVTVCGPLRKELREFFEEEAASELKHVLEFSELIVHLGGVPGTEVASYPTHLKSPYEILRHIQFVEQEVSNNYASRLEFTGKVCDASFSYAHIFYENQLEDSWRAAQEARKMITQIASDCCKE